MQWKHLVAVLWGVAALSACGTQSPKEKLRKELKSATSWAAAAEMVAVAWERGAVPKAYAKQTLQTAQEELQKETDILAKVEIEPAQRQDLIEGIERIESSAGGIAAAVEREDRAGAGQSIKELEREVQELRHIAQKLGERK